MPNVNELSESKYVMKEDVGDGMLVTIKGFKRENVAKESESASIKYILGFNECKPLVLNKTNGNRISVIMHEIYNITRDYQQDGKGKCPGNERFANWVGKQIVLFNDPTVEFSGKIVGGIRVRAPEDIDGQLGDVSDEQADAGQAEQMDDIPF